MFALLRKAVFGLSLVSLTFGSVGRSHAQSVLYTITDLGFTEATSINNRGQISGIQNPGEQAVLWENGAATPLGSYFTRPTRINEAGHVVGYRTGEGGNVPLLWRDGQEIELGLAGTYPWDINNRDQIVGYYGGPRRAFLYDNGQIQDLTNLLPPDSGWVLTSAHAINDSGQIVGAGRHNNLRRLFFYDAGTVTDLGPQIGNLFTHQRLTEEGRTFFTTAVNNVYHVNVYDGSGFTELEAVSGFTGSFAFDMNEAGEVVGFFGESFTGHAALWQNGMPIDLNDVLQNGEGWTLAEATGINDLGQIVGYGFYRNQTHSFLLTPVAAVPEPGSWALFAVGAAGLLMRRRALRRK
jgi:probable HAF family extracellular repeat protein